MKERPIIMTGESVRAILAGTKTQTRRIIKKPRAVTRGAVRPDFANLTGDRMVAVAGKRYPANIAAMGAVSVDTGDGWLGVKPGEFDFACPYADGSTYLDKTPNRGGWRIDVAPQQRLWVKETWQMFDAHANGEDVLAVGEERLRRGKRSPIDGVCDERAIEWTAAYRADGEIEHPELGGARWRSPLHMPRWASRITLTVASVRVERLQAISEADARAEGVRCHPFPVCDGYMFGPDDGKSTLYPTAVLAYAAAWDAIHGKKSPWLRDLWVWVITFEVAA